MAQHKGVSESKRTQTRWKRFAVAALPATLAASGLMVGIANGAVPVALNVAGETFKVSASLLEGTGFTQYASAVTTPSGDVIPVAASEIDSATLTDLCQSVHVSALGLEGSLLITAGDAGEPAEASNLVIGLDELRGDATFSNIFIGADSEALGGVSGTIGQTADSIRVENLEQTAFSTQAGTFTLNNLRLRVTGGEECFDWN